MLLVFLLQSFNRINNKFPYIGIPQLSSPSKMPNISQGWYTLKFYMGMFLVFLLESFHSYTNNSPTLVHHYLALPIKCQLYPKANTL